MSNSRSVTRDGARLGAKLSATSTSSRRSGASLGALSSGCRSGVLGRLGSAKVCRWPRDAIDGPDAPLEAQSRFLLARDDWTGLSREPVTQPSYALVDLYEPPTGDVGVEPTVEHQPTIKSEPPSPVEPGRPLFAPEHFFTPEPTYPTLNDERSASGVSGESGCFPFIARRQRSVSTARPASEILNFDAFTRSSPATIRREASSAPLEPRHNIDEDAVALEHEPVVLDDDAIALEQIRSFDVTTWQRARADRLQRPEPTLSTDKIELGFRLPLSPRSAAICPFSFDIPSSPLPPADQHLSVDWLLKRPRRAVPAFFVPLEDEE